MSPKRGNMNAIKFGAGFTIFILFFGIALLDAALSGNWIRVVFWLLIGAVFLIADNIRTHKRT